MTVSLCVLSEAEKVKRFSEEQLSFVLRPSLFEFSISSFSLRQDIFYLCNWQAIVLCLFSVRNISQPLSCAELLSG